MTFVLMRQRLGCAIPMDRLSSCLVFGCDGAQSVNREGASCVARISRGVERLEGRGER